MHWKITSTTRKVTRCLLGLALIFVGVGTLRTIAADAFLWKIQRDQTSHTFDWSDGQQSRVARLFTLALHCRPDRGQDWSELAQFQLDSNPDGALKSIETGLHLRPTDWNLWVMKGQFFLSQGQLDKARRAFTEAMRLNKGYDARIQMATFSLVIGDKAAFYQEATSAVQYLQGQPDDIRSRVQTWLQLIRESSGGQQGHVAALFVRAPLATQLLAAQLSEQQHQFEAASEILIHLFSNPAFSVSNNPVRSPAVALALSQDWLQQTPSPESVDWAIRVWNAAVQAGVVSANEERPGQVQDPCFRQPVRSQGFGWRTSGPIPVHRLDNGIELDFTGNGEDTQIPIWQWMPLTPGRTVEFQVQTKVAAGPPASGLWVDLVQGQTRLYSMPLALGADSQLNQGSFLVPPGLHMARLEIRYDRPPGKDVLQQPVDVGCLKTTRK